MSADSEPREGSDDVQADSGNPNQDRAFLGHTPPAQVDEEIVQEHSKPTADEPGDDDAAARN